MLREKIERVQKELRELIPVVSDTEALIALPTFSAFLPISAQLTGALYSAWTLTGDERAKALADCVWYWGEFWFTHNEDTEPATSIALIEQFIQELEIKKSQETV